MTDHAAVRPHVTDENMQEVLKGLHGRRGGSNTELYAHELPLMGEMLGCELSNEELLSCVTYAVGEKTASSVQLSDVLTSDVVLPLVKFTAWWNTQSILHKKVAKDSVAHNGSFIG